MTHSRLLKILASITLPQVRANGDLENEQTLLWQTLLGSVFLVVFAVAMHQLPRQAVLSSHLDLQLQPLLLLQVVLQKPKFQRVITLQRCSITATIFPDSTWITNMNEDTNGTISKYNFIGSVIQTI
jgi:hypothetical protein